MRRERDGLLVRQLLAAAVRVPQLRRRLRGRSGQLRGERGCGRGEVGLLLLLLEPLLVLELLLEPVTFLKPGMRDANVRPRQVY